jgi:hypothetical protein
MLQELVDSARRLLDANTAQLQQLCSRSGFTPPDDRGVHQAYDAAVKEWEGQMLQRVAGLCLCLGFWGMCGLWALLGLWRGVAAKLLGRQPAHASSLRMSAWRL